MRNDSVQFRSKGILGGLGILLLLAILRSFTIVNASEKGVVMLNGQVQKTILDEGIHPILPIVTQVKKISVRIQKTDVSEQQPPATYKTSMPTLQSTGILIQPESTKFSSELATSTPSSPVSLTQPLAKS